LVKEENGEIQQVALLYELRFPLLTPTRMPLDELLMNFNSNLIRCFSSFTKLTASYLLRTGLRWPPGRTQALRQPARYSEAPAHCRERRACGSGQVQQGGG
jgi:hypothetical protein